MQGVWQGGGDVVDVLGGVVGIDGYRCDDLYGLTEEEIAIVEGTR